jgi:hypothetical protein
VSKEDKPKPKERPKMQTAAGATPSLEIKRLHAKFGMGTPLKAFARALAGTDKNRVNLVHAWFANKAPRPVEKPKPLAKPALPEKQVFTRKR